MTRRKSKAIRSKSRQFRSQRIRKLIERGWIRSADEIPDDTLPVDPDLVNRGGSYDYPVFFRDQPFTCRDCGADCVWKAENQRWYFETTGAPYYQRAVRCRPCRIQEHARKREARRQAGHART